MRRPQSVRRALQSMHGGFDAAAHAYAADVPALLDALEAAEAEVARWKRRTAEVTWHGRYALGTEGGASSCDHIWHEAPDTHCAKGCGAVMPAGTEGGAS